MRGRYSSRKIQHKLYDIRTRLNTVASLKVLAFKKGGKFYF